jgi:hypothetical protein
MTFREARLSLVLLVEEEIGAPRYWDAMSKRVSEDKLFAAATGKT